ncbi:hypothetical protein NP493_454g03030 [Ridgeia piscesae]|uniref:Uncharacterized protein n=1 Tax=Ridgeia piscesae TaxID=27915 RepID=A0AAD9NRY0_RIDPI|nr:hypothetical protein NP493_454g03030 [Ridgeia piscesae]
MPTCSCMCYELIFRCYCGRPRTNVVHLKKLETLPTLVGTSKAPPSHRPSQQCQLLPVVSCSCTAECKACSGTRCSCNRAGVSCTASCKCEEGDI